MGLAEAGTAIQSGANLAIQGVRPSGIAAQGQAIWRTWQLVASAYGSSTGTTTVTLNTSGANLIVVMASHYSYYAQTITDSQNNVWTLGIGSPINLYAATFLYYAIHPVTSTNHQITFTGFWPAVVVMAFKTPAAISFDQATQNTNPANGLIVQLPPINPVASSLVLTAAGTYQASVSGVDSEFIIPQPNAMTQLGGAYRIIDNSPPASLAPTWTAQSTGTGTSFRALLLSFKQVPLWTLLATTYVTYSAITTPTIDTTGADLIVIVCGFSQFVSGTSVTAVSDTYGNTWVNGVQASAYYSVSEIWYSRNPTVGTGHSFTIQNQQYNSCIVLAYKLNQKSGIAVDKTGSYSNINAGPTILPGGSLTPSVNNTLVVATAANRAGNVLDIDSDFTLVQSINRSTTTLGVAGAYKIPGVETVAPNWTVDVSMYPGSPNMSATMLSFRPVVSSAWQLLGSVIAPSLSTSTPIDTRGTTLLVAVFFRYSAGTPTFTDNQNNTWIQIAQVGGTGSVGSQVFYCVNPTTAASHTFTLGGVNFSTFQVLAFAGPATITMNNSVNVAVATGVMTVQLPSLTPADPNTLLITATGTGGTMGAVDSNFTITGNVPNTPGSTYGGAAAYLVTTTLAPVAPTWTLSVGGTGAGTVAQLLSFKPS